MSDEVNQVEMSDVRTIVPSFVLSLVRAVDRLTIYVGSENAVSLALLGRMRALSGGVKNDNRD